MALPKNMFLLWLLFLLRDLVRDNHVHRLRIYILGHSSYSDYSAHQTAQMCWLIYSLLNNIHLYSIGNNVKHI